MDPKQPRTIPAGEFKARCLKLLDEVQRTGEELIVTKRGRPVARVVPTERPETDKEILAHARRFVGLRRRRGLGAGR